MAPQSPHEQGCLEHPLMLTHLPPKPGVIWLEMHGAWSKRHGSYAALYGMIQDDDSGLKTEVTAQNMHMTVTSMVHPGGSDAEGPLTTTVVIK
jgi:hypothetical protein